MRNEMEMSMQVISMHCKFILEVEKVPRPRQDEALTCNTENNPTLIGVTGHIYPALARKGLRSCCGLEWPHTSVPATHARTGRGVKRKGTQT